MPAIQIARLRTQMAQLMALYHQPAQFLRGLHDLLDFYTDRTYRPGQAGKIQPLLPHYKVPLPVIRQIETELAGLCTQDPQAGLDLADTLWMDSYFEPRLLAIYLLSLEPVSLPEPVLQRLSAWARPEEDQQVLKVLITRGAGRLMREQTDCWSDLVKGWLADERPAVQSMGLHALLAIVEDENFQNLPVIFHLISPSMHGLPANLQSGLLAVLQALARRSPAETAYFLRQILTLVSDPLIPRLIRRCLPNFSPETQAGLRAALKSREG
jgi:hypothetical protein